MRRCGTPRSFRGLLSGTRDDGLLRIEFTSGAITLHQCPMWTIDELLLQPALLGPGLYILVGMGERASSRPRALIGEGGLLQERLTAHSTDPRLDFVWDVVAVTGPRVMCETIRLIMQRRLIDEIRHHGCVDIANRHDAERHSGSEFDRVAADEIMCDLRPLLCLAIPGLVSTVEPVVVPIGARTPSPPRGVDQAAPTWTKHELRYRGANAIASIGGGSTILHPGSTIIGAVQPSPRWLIVQRSRLAVDGLLEDVGDGRLVRVKSFITFKSVGDATSFVTGGASLSARLAWMLLDDT